MKKVLIIYIYFLQENFIGTVRVRGLAKYLHDFGWDATILTVKLPNTLKTFKDTQVRIIETGYHEDSVTKWKKKFGIKTNKSIAEQIGSQRHKNKKTSIDIILNCIGDVIAYPDSDKAWYNPAVDVGHKLLREESFDAIITSSPTATHHLIGNELKKRCGIPWIADLRDLWTQDHYSEHNFLRRFIEKRLELKTLSRADALSTVSQPLAEKLKELHNRKEVHVILNGFDPDQKDVGTSLSDRFNIIYTGRMLGAKQDPEPLFNAIQKLISDGIINREDIAVDFYGDTEDWLGRDIEKYGLQDIVRVHGLIPREQALKKQREAQVLLLLTWNDPNEKGVYTGKIFEYLAAQRPILSIGISGGVVEELLSETNAGIHASTQKEIEDALKNFYCEFRSNGQVGYNGIDSEVNKYSQQEMAGKFAAVLNTIVRR